MYVQSKTKASIVFIVNAEQQCPSFFLCNYCVWKDTTVLTFLKLKQNVLLKIHQISNIEQGFNWSTRYVKKSPVELEPANINIFGQVALQSKKINRFPH